MAACSEGVARQGGRLAETKGAYVRLARDGGPTDEPEKARLGTSPSLICLGKGVSRRRLDQEAARRAPGSLEASGLLWLLMWLTRSTKHFSCRVPVLVDAQAILGAAAKGRTSARSISQDLRRIAVFTFSSDVLPSYVYVPSEDNPADAPSRNIRRRKLRKRGPRPAIGKLLVKSTEAYGREGFF